MQVIFREAAPGLVDVSEHIDEVGAELRRAVVRLYSRFRSERVEGEVSEEALLVLIVLDKQGPMSLSGLSQTVRRLEQLAYVTKSRGTQDRRKVLFTLTGQGREESTASRRHRQDWLNGRLAELTAAERDDILRVAPLLLRIADS